MGVIAVVNLCKLINSPTPTPNTLILESVSISGYHAIMPFALVMPNNPNAFSISCRVISGNPQREQGDIVGQKAAHWPVFLKYANRQQRHD